MASDDREATKRLAQQGQWKTPPLPVFASGAASMPAAAPPTNTAPISDLEGSIPTTPDEYARMLQEAYKRGAEAASRAQNAADGVTGEEASFPNAVRPGALHHPGVAAPQQYPRPQVATPFGGPAAKSVTAMHANAANNYNFPLPQQVPAMVVQQQQHQQPTAIHKNSHSKTGGVHKAVSMPDISSFNHQETATDEEEKRKKRLARNRASARLRRLKKKNLVDSYEGEVSILEAALTKLRSHRWSDASEVNNHEALIEALSMERGQQLLTPESRRDLIQNIVSQQKQQVDNLLQCQLENWMLRCLADSNPDNDNDPELKELTSELSNILQLTPQQLSDISQSTANCLQEIHDLQTVSSCLDLILNNEWLLDSGVDEIASQFTSILNPSQVSKFLLWTDHNAESIDKLDFVNLKGDGVEVGEAPVFEFGVDEGIEGGD